MFWMKGIFLIVLSLLVFSGFVSAYPQFLSHVSGGGGSSLVQPHAVLSTALVLSPVPVPPVISPPIVVVQNRPPLGTGARSNHSDLSTSEVKIVLGSYRTYDSITRKWSFVPHSKEWKERFVTSWAMKGNKLGVVRVDGSIFFNGR